MNNYLSSETIITNVNERVVNRPKTNDIFAFGYTHTRMQVA